jgi:hypothetical protein
MQRRFLVGLLCLALVLGLVPLALPTAQAQDGVVMTHEPDERSGGSYRLHQSSAGVTPGPYSGRDVVQSPTSPVIGTSFDGFNYDDNAAENGGYHFIPPDPIGAAGTDRLIAVVNVMIEARSKTGTLLWRDGLETFFSSLSPPSLSLFDPKVVYDHYENRFLVVALEQVGAGSNPSAGNTSRILLAVSKTASPASATSTDWYYTAINGKEAISGLDYWTDYPGFEVDEEAVYITGNLFLFSPYSGGSSYSRLWIVDKGTSAGFYFNGSTPTVTKYDPYTLSGSSFAMTTMPAQVYGTGGAGGSVGTYLVGYSGLTGGGNEYVQVIRVDNPLGAATFTVAYVNVGNIENPVSALPDAPQLGSTTDIEVNDRRALDAVWRNNKLWLTTTINPNSSYDSANADQTTAHWFKLDTSTWPPTLDDQGNIGGEDIATGTYTYFPSLAVNNIGDAKFGFSASASTIYAGAYATAHLSGDPASTVQASETVRAGVDYYVRIFASSGGTRNRWGDYTGAALDPTDDNVVWLFNQYAMARGSASGGEDGRWGTVWATNLFTPPTWGSYSGNYFDLGGTANDYFDNFSTEHIVYMYGTGFTSGTSYKVVYWDGATKRTTDIKTVVADGKLKSQWTLDPSQANAGDWHVAVYTSSANPSSYSPTDPNIVVDDTSYTGGYAFHVAASAIPEFPTVLAAIVALALSAGIYLWMRRRAAPVPA